MAQQHSVRFERLFADLYKQRGAAAETSQFIDFVLILQSTGQQDFVCIRLTPFAPSGTSAQSPHYDIQTLHFRGLLPKSTATSGSRAHGLAHEATGKPNVESKEDDAVQSKEDDDAVTICQTPIRLLIDYETGRARLALMVRRQVGDTCVHSEFYYTRRNIASIPDSRTISVRKISDFADVSYLHGTRSGLDQRHALQRKILTHGCVEIHFAGEAWSDPDRSYGFQTHLRDCDYHPNHLPVIKAIRDHLEVKHTVRILLFGDLDNTFERVCEFRDAVENAGTTPEPMDILTKRLDDLLGLGGGEET